LTRRGAVAIVFNHSGRQGGGIVRNKLYTIPTCPHCPVARAYLVAKGVDFIEFDVSVDVQALRMMLSMTARTEVPTIVAGDRAVVGFNPASWDELLVRSAEIQRKDPYELPESLGPDPYRGVD
jgi:glutaredoxin